MSIHQHNPCGIALVVDEIRALFNSVKRYNNRNNLIEDLLTAYSGQPLKVIRKSEARPILIRNPCINIIGSVQTNLLPEIFRSEYMANGLLDRFLFVYPKDRRISDWKRDDGTIARPDLVGQWREVLDRIVSLPYPTEAVLNMADDAEEYFYNWYNGIIEEVNAIEDDAEVESRKMKLNGNAARLSLVFQVLKWATERWREKSALLANICKRVVVSDMLERLATDEQRSRGLDIADFFLTVPTQRQILQQMIRQKPALQLLIDELNLELVE